MTCPLLWHAVGAVHAICHPQLSVPPSLTLNHRTELCEKGKKKSKVMASPRLAGLSQRFSLSLFHFLFRSFGRTSLLVTAPPLSSCRTASRRRRNLADFERCEFLEAGVIVSSASWMNRVFTYLFIYSLCVCVSCVDSSPSHANSVPH